MEFKPFTQTKNKSKICDMLGISRTTLAYYLNVRYFADLQKLDYHKRQKHLTPKQLNFLQEKIDLQENGL